TVGSLPVSPPAHPIRKDIVIKRRPATMVVSPNGLTVAFMALVCGKKSFCVGKWLIDCSTKWIGCTVLVLLNLVCEVGRKTILASRYRKAYATSSPFNF